MAKEGKIIKESISAEESLETLNSSIKRIKFQQERKLKELQENLFLESKDFYPNENFKTWEEQIDYFRGKNTFSFRTLIVAKYLEYEKKIEGFEPSWFENLSIACCFYKGMGGQQPSSEYSEKGYTKHDFVSIVILDSSSLNRRDILYRQDYKMLDYILDKKKSCNHLDNMFLHYRSWQNYEELFVVDGLSAFPSPAVLFKPINLKDKNSIKYNILKFSFSQNKPTYETA